MEQTLYVPLENKRLYDEATRKVTVEKLRAVEAKTVFLTWISDYYSDDRSNAINLLQENLRFLESQGFEVGVWISDFGYGTPMSAKALARTKSFTRIKSVTGFQKETMEALCPEDPGFRQFYADFLRDLLKAKPKMIMLDDDLCLSVRPGVGCFCDRHMKLLNAELDEDIYGKPLDKLLFTGKSNRYRSAWLKVMGQSMKDFCRMVRDVVDEEDPTIRVGFCAGYTSWDVEGADALELTKILAGDTSPFLRLSGAPYWVAKDMRRFGGQRLNAVIEFARVQQRWCENSGVEIFAEADSYPRNIHIIPANLIENFAMAVYASGGMGLENYFFDYNAPLEYECGYWRHFIHHKSLREFVKHHMANKPAAGVYVCEPMRKVENWPFPEDSFMGEGKVMETAFSPVAALLTSHGIPTCYHEKATCAAAFGDCVNMLDKLPRKMILDVRAAQCLQEKGVDVGLISVSPARAPGRERFGEATISTPIAWGTYYQCELQKKAKVLSYFISGDTEYPAVYRYDNGTTEFMVYAFDGYTVNQAGGSFLSNLRRTQLLDFVDGICSIDGFPGVYQICKQEKGETAILFENLYEDEMFDFKIQLDRTYQSMEVYGIEGTLEGDEIRVHSEVPPFGMFAVVLR